MKVSIKIYLCTSKLVSQRLYKAFVPYNVRILCITFISLFLSLEVPELAGFWLLSFLFQLPILLFFMTDPDIIILPLERAVHSLYLAFLLAEILASFLALRVMTCKLALQFHMSQFGPIQSLHTVEALPMLGLSHGSRSVLPVMDIPQPQ